MAKQILSIRRSAANRPLGAEDVPGSISTRKRMADVRDSFTDQELKDLSRHAGHPHL